MNVFNGPLVDITTLTDQELKDNLMLVLKADNFDGDDFETFAAMSGELLTRMEKK